MRVAILAATLVLAGAPAAAQPVAPGQPRSVSPGRDCYGSIFRYADENKKTRPQRLGELPPGNLILGVVRDIAGCQRPVVVRYGIGAGGTERPRAPRPRPAQIR